MLRGIDVSSHQPQINWATVAAINDFAIVKATGGTTYQNPKYRAQIGGARNAGLVVGHYHFAFEASLHTMPGAGPEAEADFFLSKADVRTGELVVLDFEESYWDNARPGGAWLEEWSYRWLTHVEQALGFKPMYYSYPHYITSHGLGTTRLAKYPLWFARYWTPYAMKPWPATPAKWKKIAMWQWSGGTTVTGIPNDTDENLFDGSLSELKALGKPIPVEPPVEDRPTLTTTIDASGTPVTVIRWAGKAKAVLGTNAVDIGVSVTGLDGGTYHRSLQQNMFKPWVKE